MLIDHIGFPVSDYAKSREYYRRALAPLGVELITEVQGWAGFGRNGKPEFWFGEHPDAQLPMHVAFAADSREEARQFYQAAIEAGGRDNGPPGLREIYHPDCYGAFVLDPDGHNREAVCHRPE